MKKSGENMDSGGVFEKKIENRGSKRNLEKIALRQQPWPTRTRRVAGMLTRGATRDGATWAICVRAIGQPSSVPARTDDPD